MKPLLFAIAAGLLVTGPAAGQANIQNARLIERAADDLPRTFQQLAAEAGPLWIGYSVPAHADWNSCCSGNSSASCCNRCALEDRKGDGNLQVEQRPVPLEADAAAVILYRVEGGHVAKVRAFSQSCELDAGGRTVYWLTGVKPAASIALLKGVLQRTDAASSSRRPLSEAMLAITAHQAPEAVATLIDLARNGPESRVRGEALFWLSQRAGARAAGTITDAIANDPDTKVKERAVFALSQLPKDEGVPKLIEVARTNRNPRVRQQAVFWLGQSKDPRALAFFEEILLK